MRKPILKIRTPANRPPAGPRRKLIWNSKSNINFVTVQVPTQNQRHHMDKSEGQEKRDGEDGKATATQMLSGGKSHKWAHVYTSSGILTTSYHFT